MSDSGMPFAVNPAKIAPQFVVACPPIARDSASCCISSRRAPLVAVMGDCLSVQEGQAQKTRPAGNAPRGPERSAEHLAGFNRLECGAEIVAAVLNQLDVALNRFAVEPFALRDLLRPFGERSGQVAA